MIRLGYGIYLLAEPKKIFLLVLLDGWEGIANWRRMIMLYYTDKFAN